MANDFISPMWGGIIVWNPPACVENFQMQHLSRHKISSEDLKVISEVSMGQSRQLFVLESESLYVGGFATSILLISDKGFAEWELDFYLGITHVSIFFTVARPLDLSLDWFSHFPG